MRSVDDLTAAARIRDAAIERFGEQGFSVGLRSIAEAAGVSAALVIHHFGSKDGLRKACDDYVAEEIRSSKSEAMNSSDPATWFAAMAEIEEYAPLMAYLVRSMQAGGELARTFWRTMIDNAESYLDEGVTYRHPEAQPRSRCPVQVSGDHRRRRLPAVHPDARDPNGSAGSAPRLRPGHGATRPGALHQRSDDRQPYVRGLSRSSRTRRI